MITKLSSLSTTHGSLIVSPSFTIMFFGCNIDGKYRWYDMTNNCLNQNGFNYLILIFTWDMNFGFLLLMISLWPVESKISLLVLVSG